MLLNAAATHLGGPFMSTLAEYGFWDYTTPGAGGIEQFSRDDYLTLLDDMAAAAMDSLMICVKWSTTGYRSCLPFLDQLSGNPVIASDNALLREVIDEAAARGIKVWLGAVVSIYAAEKYGIAPYEMHEMTLPGTAPLGVGVYDADSSEFTERAVQIAEELITLFPGIHGLEIEMEGSGKGLPHRAAAYNAWAEANGRVPFEQLGRPLDPRPFDVPDWRDYATARRLDTLEAIERAVRANGFSGKLATILETAATPYAAGQEINLDVFKGRCPTWTAITYEYDKWRHRHAMMDFCIEQPRSAGIPVHYLPRGVMTWTYGCDWPLPIALEESWRRDIEDVARFRPDGLWWFGAGAVGEGAHVSTSRLNAIGYTDGVAARRALLKAAEPLRTRPLKAS